MAPDQTCTYRGQPYQYPCIGSVIEKCWDRPGQFSVILHASLPGGPVVQKIINVGASYKWNGTEVVRKEIRTVTPSEWTEVVQTIYETRRLGIWDHMVAVHWVYLIPITPVHAQVVSYAPYMTICNRLL